MEPALPWYRTYALRRMVGLDDILILSMADVF